MTTPARVDVLRLAAGLAALAAVTAIYAGWLGVSNPTIVGMTFLTVVLLVAATARLRVALAVSVAAMLLFNFFFLPPVGTLTIADPQNWVALFAFLAVSVVASNLSAVARARTAEAIGNRDELARLFDLSRDVLVMTEGREALPALARSIVRRFDLAFVALALPNGDDWDVFEAGAARIPIDRRELAAALAAAQAVLEFDAASRTYAGHRVVTSDGGPVRLVPLRVGTRPIGVLAAAGRAIEAGTLDALGGVVAIAIERVRLLEERKAAAITKQSEELKTALLASLGHDLRTPLTAIRVAATNLTESWLEAADRREQSQLILAEVERLSRLFQNIIEMARIDAGAVSTDARRAHPSEIIAAARDQVTQALMGHPINVDVEPDAPLQLDPMLAASALAHLLENAAQYAPPGSVIDVTARSTPDELTIAVRDRGPGIAAADLPHLFDRFYRGDAGRTRTSGTGMGLWIARGLLAAARGRVWAEPHSGGGALFTMILPTTTIAKPVQGATR
jgi:two-component system sensor histidine kinase KdpD